METLILVFATIFGLIIGSFLNVCIYRIPRNKSIVWPPSGCPKCGKHIAFYDNIPLLSYLILWGKCRHCKAPISCQYPIVEFITGALTLLFVWHWGLTPWTAVLLTAVYCLIILSVIDLELMIIPDRFSLGLIVLGLATFALNPNFAGTLLDRFLQSLLGAGVGFFGTLAVALLGYVMFKKEAMGGGDIKLLFVTGMYIGWAENLLALFFACIIGIIAGVVQQKKADTDESVYFPFGPSIALGAFLSMLVGNELIGAYLSLFI